MNGRRGTKTAGIPKSAQGLREDIVAVGIPFGHADRRFPEDHHRQRLAGIRNDTRYIQISTPIQPGNSGGAVVDRTDAGITSATLSKRTADEIRITAHNVNFTIRASVAELFLQSQSLVPQASDARYFT